MGCVHKACEQDLFQWKFSMALTEHTTRDHSPASNMGLHIHFEQNKKLKEATSEEMVQ